MQVELTPVRGPYSGATSSLIAQWRVGAIVEATAVRDTITGQLSLAIGSLRLPARIASGNAAGPASGEKLQLRVLRTSPVLALETMQTSASDDAGDVVTNALRMNVPRQSSAAPLLANLSWLTNMSGESDGLPPAVMEAVSKIMQSLPNATDLGNADELATALQRSGVFLESTLKKMSEGGADVPLDADFKALLLALKQTLTRAGAQPNATSPSLSSPLPNLRGPLLPLASQPASLAVAETAQQKLDSLAQQVDGALARLTTTQLMNAEVAPNAFMLEVPVQRDNRSELLRFRFSKRDGAPTSGESSWVVDASLHLGIAGAVHAKVSLQGSRISVQLRGESAVVVAELSARSEELAALLRNDGLNVDRVVCLHGLPPDESAPVAALLDVRA
jgi:hypothetical protein